MRLNSYEKLMGLRLLLATGVATALPLSHMWWGNPPGEAGIEGQKAMGFVLAFFAIGIAFAVGYVVVGCAIHLIFRRRPTVVASFDVIIAMVLMLVLIIAGITAKYSGGQ